MGHSLCPLTEELINMVNTERTRLSNRDKIIIVGTVLAVVLAILVISRGIMSDRPQPVNEAPKNVVGTSAKAMEMKEEQAAKAKQGAAAAQPAGPGGGDDVLPAGAGKR
jgi:hypothetical protein